MTAAFTMVFVLNPGDCDIDDWIFTNQAVPPQEIGTKTRLGSSGVFKWTYGDENTTATSLSVSITGPTNQQMIDYGGMPDGMSGLVVNHYDPNDESTHDTTNMTPRWHSLAPYQPIFYDNIPTTLTLSRSDENHVYYNVFYPTWVPDRVTSGARALLMIPANPPFDFGEIQSISKTYHANNTVIPIMCYGYRRSFVMDLGTTMTISLKYIRVQPRDWKPEDDDSGDSRLWSNGKWLDSLRALMDRWQMQTNGQTFYLLNPKNTQDRIPTAATKEILGANCYISSAPINYADMGPHAISGSVELQVGTLYPKKETPPMTTIKFKLGGPAKTAWTTDHCSDGHDYSYTKIMSYPVDSAFLLPEFYPWDARFQSATYNYQILGWSLVGDITGGTIYDAKELVKVSDVPPTGNERIVYAITSGTPRVPGETDISCFDPGVEHTFVVAPNVIGQSYTIFITLVGGGGGGASGYVVGRYYRGSSGMDAHYYRAIIFAGGGGGEAGERVSNSYTEYDENSYTFKLGTGGEGGGGTSFNSILQSESNNRDVGFGYGGGNGLSSSIKRNGVPLFSAAGGLGGNAARWGSDNYAQSPGGGTSSTGGGPDGGSGGRIWDDYSDGGSGVINVTYDNQGSSGAGAASPGTVDSSHAGIKVTAELSGRDGLFYWWSYFTWIASGAGGGGGVITNDNVGSYGGKPGDARSNKDNFEYTIGGDGYRGGGGGGGAIACEADAHQEKIHRTASGGRGGSGYIIVSVSGGRIISKDW